MRGLLVALFFLSSPLLAGPGREREAPAIEAALEALASLREARGLRPIFHLRYAERSLKRAILTMRKEDAKIASRLRRYEKDPCEDD